MAKNATGSAAAMFLASISDKAQSTFQMIPAVQIVLHDHNTAAKNDTPEQIRELADSIEVNGLIHPLVVVRIDENVYRLLSGERRYRAITEYLHWDTIPCMVYEHLSPALETLVLLAANLDVREYTAADKLELYMEADRALRSMKESGDYKGSVQRGVAAMLGVSERQIRNYKRAVEGVGKEHIREVENITTASQKAAVTSAFDTLCEQDLLAVLKRTYNTASVEDYYRKNLPTPKEAALLLKPDHGYSGFSGVLQGDERSLHVTRTRNNIDVRLGNQHTVLSYTEAERAIRRAIVANQWSEATDTDVHDTQKADWVALQDARDDLIFAEIDQLPRDRRPSAAFNKNNQSCKVSASLLDRLADESSQFAMSIAGSSQCLMPGDYDFLVLAVKHIAEEIKALRLEFEINSIYAAEDFEE